MEEEEVVGGWVELEEDEMEEVLLESAADSEAFHSLLVVSGICGSRLAHRRPHQRLVVGFRAECKSPPPPPSMRSSNL